MKKFYLATVCFIPPVFALLLPAVFLWNLRVPVEVFPFVIGYFWLGLVILVVDLWRSGQSKDRKILWTVLNLAVGLVTLPFYWFMIVRNGPIQSPQPTAVNRRG